MRKLTPPTPAAASRPYKPQRAFLGWIGGKSKLVKTINPLIPAHTTYIEVFAGAAWLLFHKPPSKVEIINDINVDLVTLYRVVQHHLPEFLRLCEWVVASREGFELLKAQPPELLTDVQRALRFYLINRNAFACRMTKPTFATGKGHAPRFNPETIVATLRAAHDRLARVTVENLPFTECITRMDSPESFFYCDPPYWDCEDYYGKGLFSKADFERLHDHLAAAKGKWLVSINDVPEIRRLFRAFAIHPVRTVYTANSTTVKPVQELLIANYDLPTVDKP